jgi:hypothetical protein
MNFEQRSKYQDSRSLEGVQVVGLRNLCGRSNTRLKVFLEDDSETYLGNDFENGRD